MQICRWAHCQRQVAFLMQWRQAIGCFNNLIRSKFKAIKRLQSLLKNVEYFGNCLSPAYEPAVDLWSNTNAMEVPSQYSPSLVPKSYY